MKKLIYFFPILFLSIFITACSTTQKNSSQAKKEYGVFLSVDASEIEKLTDYQTVVIDAQYFSKQDIQTLHENGTTVYTYLNIGSLENFRDYYSEYQDLAIGDYDHWDEEKWIDVSNPEWQTFIAELSSSLLDKGIDGFFVDNCDVYDYSSTEEIFSGLTEILHSIKALGKEVIINGGESYVTRYRQLYGSAKDIMSGVNQEEVFSLYDFDNASFEKNTSEETAYYCEYVEACSTDKMDVYLLEYTDDSDLVTQIESYCREKGFHYYITDSIELD